MVLKIAERKVTAVDIQLNDTIDPSCSSFNVLSTKVEIKLKKQNQYSWDSLQQSTKPQQRTSKPAQEAPARPYSSKKDWNQIDKAVNEELENDKPEGEAAMQKLFSDIFAKADDDTRKAMNKSFQTSGGTVLSTNWNEVSSKNYEEEKTAPEGMQWKKYG